MAKQKADDLIDADSLESQLAKIVAKAFKTGTKEAFSGTSFVKDLNDQMEEYTKEQKAQAFNDKARNLVVEHGIDIKEAELTLLAEQATKQNESLIAEYKLTLAGKERLMNMALMAGSMVNYKKYWEEARTLESDMSGLLEENDLIKKGTKERIEQLKIQRQQEKIQKAEEEAAERLKKIDHERSELMESINEKAHIFKQALGDGRLRMALLTAGAMKLGEAFSEAYKELKEEGLSATQASHEAMTSFTDSMSTGFLTSAKSIRESRKAISDMGGTIHEAEEAGKDVAKLVGVYGGSEAAAGKMYGTMTKVVGMTKEAALHAVEFGSGLSVAAGVPADTVTKAVAENAEAAALSGPKFADSFAKAAVNAKKLGVEFSAVTGMQKSLLDFESSINAQMEASVLLGREVNLDKARELALAGDLQGMQAEILKQVGSAAEFDRMNVLQKEALAKSMGVSVSDMSKMVHGQGELTELGKEAAEAENAKAGTMAQIANAAKEHAGSILGAVPGLVLQTAQLVSQLATMKAMRTMSGTPAKGGMLGKLTGGLLGKKMDAPAPPTKVPKIPKVPKTEEIKPDKGGGMKGLANGLKSMAGSKVTQGIGNLALFGLAAIPAVAGIPFMLAVGIGGTAAGKGLSGLSEGLKGKGMGAAAISIGIGNLALFGLASIVALIGIPFMVGVALFGYLAGLGMQGLATGLKAMAKVPLQGVLVLGLLGVALIPAAFAFSLLKGVDIGSIIAFSIALPLLALAAAGLGFLFPFIVAGAASLALLGVGMIAVAGGLMVLQAAQGGIKVFESLTAVAANVGGLGGVAMAMIGIAGGLGVMAYAGMAAMPVIGALMALAVVAPALIGLGAALGGIFDGGGGGGKKEDKMDTLIAKIDTLIGVASKGGVINMDGKKVGEVVRQGLNTTGIR